MSLPPDTSLADLVSTDGSVSPSAFTDWNIYKRELERIFDKCWLFVAHASEIPQPGDFVTRRMGSERIIVSRGTSGELHVMQNACLHRFRVVCYEDSGRATEFMCPSHGWSYTSTGELIGLPYYGYDAGSEKGSNVLYHAPSVDIYHGLIFASWDANAIPLQEYLGSLAGVPDLLFERTASMEVIGPPMRSTVPSNWKLGVGSTFPNMSFIETTAPGNHKEEGSHDLQATSLLTIRQWQPLRPELTDVWTWQLMDSSAPNHVKAEARQAILHELGTSGDFEQPDGTQWSSEEPNARVFFKRWHDLITG